MSTRAHRHASLRLQVGRVLLAALASFALLAGLHAVQRHARHEDTATLSSFRIARLDVMNGLAHVIGAGSDESALEAAFDRDQGVALLAQGLDELARPELEASADERLELRDAVARARAPLATLREDPSRLVALRVAVARVETLAGNLDARAELALEESANAQDAIFALTVLGAMGLLGVLFVYTRRSSANVEEAETALHAAESARHASDAREQVTAELLRSVLASTTDAVFVKDRAGRYVLANVACERLLGREITAIEGRDDDELWDPSSARVIRRQDTQVMESGEASTHEERLTVHGEQHVFLVTKSPRRDADGRTVGLVGIARDVTERVRLADQMRESQKMEAIGRLAGGVAHDFNNLLTVINTYAELLLDELPGEEADRRESVEAIREAGQRASALTSQLLAFSRKAMVAPRQLDLHQAVAHAERLLGRLLGEDVVLSTHRSPEPCMVEMDPTQLDQVLMNLGVNARDAMPRGGRLEVTTLPVTIDEGTHAGAWAELRVRDSGEGMSPEVRARIFEPFYTTKAVGRGTGLGLSVIHGIVAQAGGHIEVQSELGRGTTFFVRLPLSVRAPSEEQAEAPRAARTLRGAETILLVEDDDAVRTLARVGLETRGYRVIAAEHGERALELAEAHAAPIDLVVTDVVMPRMGGRELVDRLRESRPLLRVLFVSGYTDDEVLRHGVAAGREPLLAKPFSPSSLASKVREVLDASRPGRERAAGQEATIEA